VANAGGLDLDEHFAAFRPGELHFFHRERLSRLPGDGGAYFHQGFPENLERVMGIEPTYSAWEADVLPLNYTR
jgi:hypothetical protein